MVFFAIVEGRIRMKKYLKWLIIVCLVVGAGLAYNYFFPVNKDDGSTVWPDRAEFVASLQTLDIKLPDLTEEQKTRYKNDFEVSLKALNQAMDSIAKEGEGVVPLMYRPLLSLGSINRDVGDYAKAESAFYYASLIQPNAYPPYAQLGDLYFRYLKDYKKAETYYLKAVEIPSTYLEDYYYNLYELYRFFLKDEKRAEDILIAGFEKYPHETNILASLANYYKEVGRTDEAITTYRKLLEVKPDSIVAKQALEKLGAL